ncbi:hypothetical protein MMC10_005159 [Thelotrema lepadinum]|nr:hypothetical protein [Thelotrema lepadinum]
MERLKLTSWTCGVVAGIYALWAPELLNFRLCAGAEGVVCTQYVALRFQAEVALPVLRSRVKRRQVFGGGPRAEFCANLKTKWTETNKNVHLEPKILVANTQRAGMDTFPGEGGESATANDDAGTAYLAARIQVAYTTANGIDLNVAEPIFFWFLGGKIAEVWATGDFVGTLKQLEKAKRKKKESGCCVVL